MTHIRMTRIDEQPTLHYIQQNEGRDVINTLIFNSIFQYELKRIDKSAENGVAAEDGSRQTQVNVTELKATDSSIMETKSPMQNEVFSIRFCVDNHQIEMSDVFAASPPKPRIHGVKHRIQTRKESLDVLDAMRSKKRNAASIRSKEARNAVWRKNRSGRQQNSRQVYH